MQKVSIVIPCYKSSRTIEKVVSDTIVELKKLNIPEYEFILVNDCSPDNGETTKVLKELAGKNNIVKVIELAKNVGQHNALLAGFRHCTGDTVIAMDDDGQTNPTQIQKLLVKYNEGHDVVFGYYPKKKHSGIRNIFTKLNYISVRILLKKPKGLKTSSFWIAKRYVIDEISKYPGNYSNTQGLFLRTTNDIVCTPIEHFDRVCGESGYTFKSLFKLWTSVIGFSTVPLKIASILGYIFAITGFIGGIVVLIMKLIHPTMAVGWPSLMVAIFIFSGIILMFLGLIGEYISRLYLGQNKQPQYVIKEKYNIDD